MNRRKVLIYFIGLWVWPRRKEKYYALRYNPKTQSYHLEV